MVATFTRSLIRPDIYDCDPNISFPFNYCRISSPRTEWLKKQGAKYVLESWDHGKKSAFTGLRPSRTPGFYIGDIFLPTGKKGILVQILKDKPQIQIVITDKRPKNLKRADWR